MSLEKYGKCFGYKENIIIFNLTQKVFSIKFGNYGSYPDEQKHPNLLGIFENLYYFYLSWQIFGKYLILRILNPHIIDFLT
jgi:hypothetical protein